MAFTVQDIVNRVEAALDRKAVSGGLTQLGAFVDTHWFMWIKDAYNKISDICRIPRATSTLTSVAAQASYTIPTDCWDGFEGIITVQYEVNGTTATTPLARGYIQELQDAYGYNWQSPPGLTTPFWYVMDDDSTKFKLVPAPVNSGDSIIVVYTHEQLQPTAYTDAVPYVLNPFIDIIPDYVIGRAMELDRQGRGSAKIAEFEGRLLRKARLKKRQGGKRRAAEGYSLDLQNYRIGFRRGRLY